MHLPHFKIAAPLTKANRQILHTSDIHLDNTIGPKGSESAGQLGFIGVVDAAIKLEVDMFLLAGDLFDHNRVSTACLDFASEQLARLHCPVVMITGNHDCMADYSIYHKYRPEDAGSHVHFIRDALGGVLEFEALGLHVWGKGIVDHAPENKPLASVPASDFDGWYIGMTHGYYVDRGGDSYSSLITPEEIEQSKLHYLALGHVHVFAEMTHGNTHAVYSGSPNAGQGRAEKTAAHVILDPDSGVRVNRIDIG